MKRVYLLFIIAILTSIFSGCAKDDDKNRNTPTVSPQNEKPTALNLLGKSLDEVLKIKYNKAELKCELWTQQTVKLDLSRTSNDSVSWDLKGESTLPRTLTLKGLIQNHQIEVEIKINSVAIRQKLQHTDVNGAIYKMLYSPYVKLNFSYKASTQFPTGPFFASGNGTSYEVNERIKNVPLNNTLATQPEELDEMVINRGSFRDYVQCLLDTDIKPEYQDQFKIDPNK